MYDKEYKFTYSIPPLIESLQQCWPYFLTFMCVQELEGVNLEIIRKLIKRNCGTYDFNF